MRRRLTDAFFIFVVCVSTLAFIGCGYSWQGRGNPWRKEKIENVYIKILKNNSLKPGAEVVFTSALLKEFSRGARLKLTSHLENADAFIEGEVSSITTTNNPSATVPQVSPEDPLAKDFSEVLISTEYTVVAVISIRLVRKKDKAVLWTQEFSQSKLYPGNNRFGAIGNTSMLINQSQQQIALSEIARNLANDIYEGMLEVF